MTRAKIRVILVSLGRTANQVASSLHRKRIKGSKHTFGSCPIAVYLTRRLKQKVGVGGTSYYLPDGLTFASGPLTKPVQRFITCFDNGEYPDLVAAKPKESV